MNVEAKRMEVPTDAGTVTYANADLTKTINLFEQYGVRLLTPNEIRAEMPLYAREFTFQIKQRLHSSERVSREGPRVLPRVRRPFRPRPPPFVIEPTEYGSEDEGRRRENQTAAQCNLSKFFW